MFFTDASPTPYDLRFKLLGVPVRIHPMFWVIALFLGGSATPQQAVVWVAAVLISVVVHEMGHALVQRAFGGSPSVVLYGFGGLAMAPGTRQSTWRNVAVSLAGPLAGFTLAAVIYVGVRASGAPRSPIAADLLNDLLFINIAWSVLNLAPIWPLDGGQVARELLVRFLPPSKGVFVSLVVSLVAAIVIGMWLFNETRSTWNAMLFGLLAYQNYEALRAYGASRGRW
ncbi:MAG: site-2 protease family protein [Planctomycetota bacterium]